jgi:flagellar basal-body rod modification protein FlgD
MTTSFTPASASKTDTSGSNTGTTAKSATQALGDEKIFLQLLVAQIKNQDPTNPADSTQFMSQLAQFSNLEQLINLNTTATAIGTKLGVSTDSGDTSGSESDKKTSKV